MHGENMPILCIAGCERSGSTVIDQILGQIPGWFTVGELADIMGTMLAVSAESGSCYSASRITTIGRLLLCRRVSNKWNRTNTQ
jgi:hypothetical protein